MRGARRALLIVNPASGRATAVDRAQQLAAQLRQVGLSVDSRTTGAAGDARAWASQAGGAVDLLLSVGGDGTLNEVINGLLDAGARTPVLPVPMGTANVVALELGLPTDLDALAQVALTGRRQSLDVGVAHRPDAGESRFVMCLGAGFDAEVVARVHAARGPRGITQRAYVLPLLAALMRRGRPLVHVVADGVELTHSAALVIVANLSRYGGDRRVCADARCDDGLLDICWVDGRERAALLRFLRGWLTDRPRPSHGVRFARAASIELAATSSVPLQIDGDPAGTLPVTVTLLPGAVDVLVPA